MQVFACKYCKIFKNSYFCRTPPVATPVHIEKEIDAYSLMFNLYKLPLIFLYHLGD